MKAKNNKTHQYLQQEGVGCKTNQIMKAKNNKTFQYYNEGKKQ